MTETSHMTHTWFGPTFNVLLQKILSKDTNITMNPTLKKPLRIQCIYFLLPSTKERKENVWKRMPVKKNLDW